MFSLQIDCPVEMSVGFQQKITILNKILYVFLLDVYNATKLKQDLLVYKDYSNLGVVLKPQKFAAWMW